MKTYGLEYIPPNDGLSIWVKLPDNMDAIELYKECNENNLAIVPGKVFFSDDDIYTNYIRLSFGSVDNGEIIQGMGILKNILSTSIKDRESKYLPFI